MKTKASHGIPPGNIEIVENREYFITPQKSTAGLWPLLRLQIKIKEPEVHNLDLGITPLKFPLHNSILSQSIKFEGEMAIFSHSQSQKDWHPMHPFPESSEESTKIEEIAWIAGHRTWERGVGIPRMLSGRTATGWLLHPINRSIVSREVQVQLPGENEINRRPDSFKGRLGKLVKICRVN